MITQILKMATDGLTVQELMACFNISYKGAYYHLNTAQKNGLLDRRDKQYFTTPVGLEELAASVAELTGEELPKVDIPKNYQLSAVFPWSDICDEWLATNKNDVVTYLTPEKMLEHAKMTVYLAIAFDDLTQIEKLKG